ncbi:MAG TPA: DUF4332 domain-containing protein [Desulfobacteraceae bacterium]|nr:DUF4332 domain-containing protein [Desulfobacteraceae bacterium]
MTYHIDAERVSLDELRKRIEETDLVPSRASLLDGIIAKMKVLEQHGITTLASLRKELKNSNRLEALSKTTDIDMQYLILLRREIEGYFPKPSALKAFDWLPGGEIAKLEGKGIRHAAALYEAASSIESRTELAKSTGVDVAILEALVRLADLTRVQWVSPTAARMLVEAGYDSASKVAAADAEDLCEALVRVNEGDRFFKGKIGLRDIKRLVRAASYVPS